MTGSDLHGRTAIITGGSRGIGLAIGQRLADAGANVVLTSRKQDSADTAAAQIGGNAIGVAAHAAEEDAAQRCIDLTLDRFGSVDILVNNAGTIRRREALEFSEADWDAVMDVNLKTLFFLSQAVARRMISRGDGKIINIASMLSFQGGVRVASYTASKSGVAGITRLLANEWAGNGINVNAIAPGYIATRNTEPLRRDEERNREILGRIPAGRWGVPGDLGGAAVFLASRASDYVHGAILPVDGGWLCR